MNLNEIAAAILCLAINIELWDWVIDIVCTTISFGSLYVEVILIDFWYLIVNKLAI